LPRSVRKAEWPSRFGGFVDQERQTGTEEADDSIRSRQGGIPQESPNAGNQQRRQLQSKSAGHGSEQQKIIRRLLRRKNTLLFGTGTQHV
jgi:hypothetical protein